MHFDVATPEQDHPGSVAKGRWRQANPVETLPEFAFVVLSIDRHLHRGAVRPLTGKRRVQRELVIARVPYKRDAVVIARNHICLPVRRVVNDSEVGRSGNLMGIRLISETNHHRQSGAEACGAQSDHELNLFASPPGGRAFAALSGPRHCALAQQLPRSVSLESVLTGEGPLRRPPSYRPLPEFPAPPRSFVRYSLPGPIDSLPPERFTHLSEA